MPQYITTTREEHQGSHKGRKKKNQVNALFTSIMVIIS